MAKFFVMTRKGHIVPSKMTSNQCKVEGHEDYDYIIKLVFPEFTKLDENDFLIDHQKIDDVIQNMFHKGSCERMHINICERMLKKLERKGLDIIAYKCSIIPVDKQRNQSGVAMLEYLYYKDGLLHPQYF